MTKGAVNLILGGFVVILLAIAALSMYLNSGLPVVHPPATQSASRRELPEGHPPVDLAGRLNVLETLSRKDPGNAQIKTQIGNVYYDLGQFQKAIDAYQASLKIQPENPSVETDQATCYHYLGQNDTALEILDKVLGYRPNFPQALFNKGIVLIEGKRKVQEGIAVWESLLRTNPDFPQRAELEKKIGQLRASVR
jgi:cytochrome c-type biogenesis protein CcmH/NrfG